MPFTRTTSLFYPNKIGVVRRTGLPRPRSRRRLSLVTINQRDRFIGLGLLFFLPAVPFFLAIEAPEFKLVLRHEAGVKQLGYGIEYPCGVVGTEQLEGDASATVADVDEKAVTAVREDSRTLVGVSTDEFLNAEFRETTIK